MPVSFFESQYAMLRFIDCASLTESCMGDKHMSSGFDPKCAELESEQLEAVST